MWCLFPVVKSEVLDTQGDKLDAEASEEVGTDFCVYKQCQVKALRVKSLVFKGLKASLLFKCVFILLYSRAAVNVLLSHGISINF